MKTVAAALLVSLSSQVFLQEELQDLIEGGNVNIFNFDEPMYGDIYGFALNTACQDDCGCDGEESGDGGDGVDLTCPPSTLAEPLGSLDFQRDDD